MPITLRRPRVPRLKSIPFRWRKGLFRPRRCQTSHKCTPNALGRSITKKNVQHLFRPIAQPGNQPIYRPNSPPKRHQPKQAHHTRPRKPRLHPSLQRHPPNNPKHDMGQPTRLPIPSPSSLLRAAAHPISRFHPRGFRHNG